MAEGCIHSLSRGFLTLAGFKIFQEGTDIVTVSLCLFFSLATARVPVETMVITTVNVLDHYLGFHINESLALLSTWMSWCRPMVR